MKKFRYILGSFVLMMLTLMSHSLNVDADVTEDIRVEQILTNMPEIKVYITGKDAAGISTESVEAYLGEERLKTDRMEAFSESGEGICYLFLLDISGSMKTADFQSAKAAVLKAAEDIHEPDSCMLLTFGDDVQCVWDGNETMEERQASLSGIQNHDKNTQMFGALKQAANFKDKASAQTRSVAIVFTDGKDDILGKASKGEALKELQVRGLPVYGMVVGNMDPGTSADFGEFARSSGGELLIADAGTVQQKTLALKEELKQAQILSLRGKTNIIKKDVEDIKLLFKEQNKNITMPAGFYAWQKDTVFPEIKTIQQEKTNQIEIVFSEPVTGADHAENFEFRDSRGKIWTPDSSAQKDDTTVLLTFENKMYAGKYTLTCRNITDKSMEMNPLKGEKRVTVKGEKRSQLAEILKSWGWLAAIAAIVLAVALAYVIYRKIKANKGLIVVNNKLTLASQVDLDVKQRVAVRPVKGKSVVLTLKIRTDGTSEAVLVRDLTSSMIAGRAEMCDLCIADVKMSNQHFVLEYEAGRIFIMDLESKNGTFVNGVRIQRKQKVAQGDVITAGNTRICVSWK